MCDGFMYVNILRQRNDYREYNWLFLQLQDIFRKKNEKKERRGDEEKRAMLVSIDERNLWTFWFSSHDYWSFIISNTAQRMLSLQ